MLSIRARGLPSGSSSSGGRQHTSLRRMLVYIVMYTEGILVYVVCIEACKYTCNVMPIILYSPQAEGEALGEAIQ